MEQEPRLERRPDRFVAQLSEDGEGNLWYLDQNRRVVVLDTGAELERERQQREPGTEAASGYPKFGTMLGFAEMAVPPGEIVPPEATAPEPTPAGAEGQRPPEPAPGPAPGPAPAPRPGPRFRDLTPEQLAEQKSELHRRLATMTHLSPEERAWYERYIHAQDRDDQLTLLSAQLRTQEVAQQRLRELEEQIRRMSEERSVATEVPPGGTQRPLLPTDIVRLDSNPEEERLDPTQVARIDLNNPPALPSGAKLMEQPEIQANPELEKNFIRVVERLSNESGKELYRKWADKEVLSDGDRQLLAYARRDFALRFHEGTKLADKLNMTDLEIAMRRNTALRDEVELYGRQQTLKEMKKQTLVLAMKMEGAYFRQITSAYPILEKSRNTLTYRFWEWAAKKHLETTGEPWGYYKEKTKGISTYTERKETRRALARKISQGRSAITNVASWTVPFLGQTPFAKADRIVRGLAWRNRKDIKHAKFETAMEGLMKKPPIKAVEEQLDTLTRFMQLTLSDDPEVRRALQEGAALAEDVRPTENGPMTIRELRGEKARVEGGALAQLQRDFDSYKRMIPGWNGKPQEDKVRLRDNWTPPSYSSGPTFTPEGRERRPSFLGGVLEALINALFSKNKQNLSLGNI